MRFEMPTWSLLILLCLPGIVENAVVQQPPHEKFDWGIEKIVDDSPLRIKFLSTVPTTAGYNFQPTIHRCCQTGKRVAKKKMVCDITRLAVDRKLDYELKKIIINNSNIPNKKTQNVRLDKLSEKISKCSAVHPKHFVKCCTEQKEFYNDRKKCQLKPKKQKRRCKQIVKKQYS